VLWGRVLTHPNVIGDFTWTGWDYLGESGVGRVDYIDADDFVPMTGIAGTYPHLTAQVGDIDMTGHRRPISYYRETVFGLRNAPYIAVHRPSHYGRPTAQSPWSWSDSVASWGWNVPADSPVLVDVYSNAEEIELVLNGHSLGRDRIGKEKPFIARFETTYRPGELIAIAYEGDRETGRAALHSPTEPLILNVRSDRAELRADDKDLAYIDILLQDSSGNVPADSDRLVSVQVEGEGVLAGLASGSGKTKEALGGTTCTTYHGRALAIVRPCAAGEIRVTVTADGVGTATLIVRSS
jgi:hypothetical protein